MLAACARRPAVPVAAPPVPPAALATGLTVQVAWNARVDLDLYLTDPTSETVYFGNNPSRTGARLLRDTRCDDIASSSAPFVETATMAEPLPGHYRVGVDFIDRCGGRDKLVEFRVVVDLAGVRRDSTGMVRPDQFQPVALEFDLLRAGEDGPLRLDPADSARSGWGPQGLVPSIAWKENWE